MTTRKRARNGKRAGDGEVGATTTRPDPALRERRGPEQPWLLPYENPLGRRFSPEFFAALPREPGVYRMLGSAGNVLYVGKAKNLRNRLRSYRNARPHEVSRKVIRLLNLVREIRWELCPSERDALLRENDLLRSERPPFNVVNKRPEGYVFLLLGVTEDAQARFRLTSDPAVETAAGEKTFGAYKGGGAVGRGVQALFRVIWAAHARDLERFEFPARLLGFRPPPEYRLSIDAARIDEWTRHLHRFLRGTSPGLLPFVAAQLLDNPAIPPFYYRMLQKDLELLREFYELGPRRHRRLVRFRLREDHPATDAGPRQAKGLRSERIEQEELDDLLVRYRFREADDGK